MRRGWTVNTSIDGQRKTLESMINYLWSRYHKFANCLNYISLIYAVRLTSTETALILGAYKIVPMVDDGSSFMNTKRLFDAIGRQTERSSKFPKQSALWCALKKRKETGRKNGKLTTIRKKVTERSEYWLSPSFDVIKTFRLHKNGSPLCGSSEDVMSSKKFLFGQAVITGVHDKLREQSVRFLFRSAKAPHILPSDL